MAPEPTNEEPSTTTARRAKAVAALFLLPALALGAVGCSGSSDAPINPAEFFKPRLRADPEPDKTSRGFREDGPAALYDFEVKCFDTVNNRNLAMSRTYTEIQSYKMPAKESTTSGLSINRPSLDSATDADVKDMNKNAAQCFVIEYTAGSLTGHVRSTRSS